MLDAARDKKKQVPLKKPASLRLNYCFVASLLVRNYNKTRAWAGFDQQQRGFPGSARLDGSVELGDIADRFTVHLLDDVALLESGSRSGRIRVNVSDHDALGPFRNLQLLPQVARQ